MSKRPTILITGDFCPVNRVDNFVSGYDHALLFNDLLPLLLDSGLVVTNLECPLTDSESKLNKVGPSLKASVKIASVLSDSGFNLVTLANNHIMDYGLAGLTSTIEACRNNGINHVGAGINFEEAGRIFYTPLGDKRIAILNFSENEFSTTHGNYPGCNGLDSAKIYYNIKQAKLGADNVIVIAHGGHEFYSLPSPRIKNTFRFFADAGASAIIQHHAHCYSGYEIYNGVPIFYGLGNFLFDIPEKRDSTWNYGYAVEITPGRQLTFRVIPYEQCNGQVGVRLLGGEQEKKFFADLHNLNEIIQDDAQLNDEFEKYCARVRNMYLSFLEPHSFRLLHFLQNRNLLPSLLSRRKRTLYSNLIRCESHRDVILHLMDQGKK